MAFKMKGMNHGEGTGSALPKTKSPMKKEEGSHPVFDFDPRDEIMEVDPIPTGSPKNTDEEKEPKGEDKQILRRENFTQEEWNDFMDLYNSEYAPKK